MGDIFPALMRDNNRAILFGSNTAGAGGAVVGFGPRINSEASFSLTVNILKRGNGQPVENLGSPPTSPSRSPSRIWPRASPGTQGRS